MIDPPNRHTVICPRCEKYVEERADSERNCVTLMPVGSAEGDHTPITLGIGTHTLGRKSAKSSATIQIDVQDFFMSKRHTQILVTPSDAGLSVTVRDAGSANGTYINERRLAPGEEARLLSGDHLRMGSTRFQLDTSH